MIRVKNTSHTLFRWQEFIWRPGEIINFNPEGFNIWEENTARQLCATYKNLVIVREEDDLKKKRAENLAKARAARKAKREQSNKAA